MQTKELLIQEFEKRVFEESYERIYKCLHLLDEQLIWKQPNPHVPAVGNLILHLCGNARQWILSGIGERPDNRLRDQEFVPQQNIRKSDLVFLLENMRTNIREVLRSMPESTLQQKRVIQGFTVNGFSIIVHVLEHFSYHTGQITTLTKIQLNQSTDYYKNIDLNQHNTPNG